MLFIQNTDLASQIREKCDIVDIIGEKIPLVARGKNFFGVCPFHDDSNPSMCVSREKQIYTCFSCHATGNVFTFLMNYNHIDFKEALKYLGDKVGISTSNIKLTSKSTKYDSFYEAYLFASKYYQNNLLSKEGQLAKNYLKTRQIDDDIIKEFGIGLSLNKRDDLTKLLVNKNYDLATLNKIGLTSDNYDIYSDRIMFPLYDLTGKVVGFSGRIYKDNDNSKYVNTKETEIFKKGECLYHYHKAIEEVRLNKSIIVMEGFMDVIRAHTIGIKNTVALMGTALTTDQLKLISRLSNNIIICLDGDNPGKKAALSVGDAFLKNNIEVKVVTLPNDDDPDTYILNNGKASFERLIENAINFSDYKINALKQNINLKSDLELSNYINAVIEETLKIDDDIRVEIILKNLAKEFNIGYNTLEKRFASLKKNRAVKEVKITTSSNNKTTKKNKYEKAMLGVIYYMLIYDWAIDMVEREKLIFPKEEYRKLISEIVYYYNKNGQIEIADFYTYLQDKEDIVPLLNEVLAMKFNDDIDKSVLTDYCKVVKEYSKNQEMKRLKKKLEEEADPLKQAKIADEIRLLRIGD